MMKQPELGKKIADLRKARGFTQEELVEKCKLNVRTLQRIESGEVMPRTYTIRLIFEALEVPIDSLPVDKGLKFKWFRQLASSFIDLFNLKTNTMRKLSILTIMIAVIVFSLFTFVIDGKAQSNKNITKPTAEKNEPNHPSDVKLTEGNFSCENCFSDNEDMIGYGVKFKKNGVSVDVQLIKLNQTTGKFNAGFVKGVFLSNKVGVAVQREWIDKRRVTYSAEDNLIKTEDKIVLKGHAKLLSSKNETIEADEIIIHLE